MASRAQTLFMNTRDIRHHCSDCCNILAPGLRNQSVVIVANTWELGSFEDRSAFSKAIDTIAVDDRRIFKARR